MVSVAKTGLTTREHSSGRLNACPLFLATFPVLLRANTLSRESIARVEWGTLIPSLLEVTAAMALCSILLVFWIRERKSIARRKMIGTLNMLGEDVLAAASAGEILRKMEEVIPFALDITSVHMYLSNRKTGYLTPVPSSDDPAPQSFDPQAPGKGLQTAIAQTLRDRSALNIPGTRRAGIFPRELWVKSPRASLLTPMFAQTELMGVLVLQRSQGVRDFSADERAAVQHLANQAAASLQLEERQRMRQQLFSSEKLAAAGQLISGVAGELRVPLENILAASESRAGEPFAATGRLEEVASEARRGLEIVSRMISFGRTDATEARPVEIKELLSGLLRFREREWKTLGIETRAGLSGDAVFTGGVHGKLEQLFLCVLMFAEQNVAGARDKTIDVSVRVIGSRVCVEFVHACPENAADPFLPNGNAGTSGLAAWRDVVHVCGGDTRFVRTAQGRCRLQIELPLSGTVPTPPAPAERRRTRILTTLVIEPDYSLRSRLVSDLTARLHRVVPVATAEEGIDLAQRMKFDLLLCSTRLSGVPWRECLDRVHDSVGAFVLMADGFEIDGGPSFGGGCFVLHKPSYDLELDTILDGAERAMVSRHVASA